MVYYNDSQFLKIHCQFFYGLHHRSPMFQVLWLHSCCAWLVDKDETFYSNHQEHGNWRYYKTFPQQHILQVPWSTTKHCWISIHIHIWKGPNQSFFDHHTQIDEQAKRKRYWNNFWCMINYHQNDWVNLLPLGELHITVHIIHHLVTLHFLQSMDDILSLIPWQWVGWIIWL